MHEFIDHDKREYDLCSIAPCLPFNVLVNIKAISIPTSPFKDRFFFFNFSQDSIFTLKYATWTIRKLSSHLRSKILNWI